jgi:hypothetical protein
VFDQDVAMTLVVGSRGILSLALAGLATAQGEIKPFPKIDPYTKDAPDAKTKAGYASFGPFRFGDAPTTAQVEETLGGLPMIWVETEHFKLGSGLPEYTIPDDKREKERLKGELERLATRLPDVKTKLKKLDPWLRLHLYAQRLEDLYAKFLVEFGLQESEFPTAPPDPKKKSRAPYMGEGRYLGMSSKFTVLLFDKKSAHARYSSVHLGQQLQGPTRFYFSTIDSWLFVTANEFLEGLYANDSALACDVTSGVSQNLALGFRGYKVGLPFAISEGIAHWFSRQFDPRYHIFSGFDQSKLNIKEEWDWAPLVRVRVDHDVFPTLDQMLAWDNAETLEWADHLMLWSRIDFLLAREDDLAGKLLYALKEPPATRTDGTPAALAAGARSAFERVTGGDLAKLDAEWSEWVLKTYPKK